MTFRYWEHHLSSQNHQFSDRYLLPFIDQEAMEYKTLRFLREKFQKRCPVPLDCKTFRFQEAFRNEHILFYAKYGILKIRFHVINIWQCPHRFCSEKCIISAVIHENNLEHRFVFRFKYHCGSRDSAVGVATGYGVD
jgi:hypothetical protein